MPRSRLRVYLLLVLKVNWCLHLSNALLLLLEEARNTDSRYSLYLKLWAAVLLSQGQCIL